MLWNDVTLFCSVVFGLGYSRIQEFEVMRFTLLWLGIVLCQTMWSFNDKNNLIEFSCVLMHFTFLLSFFFL